MAGEQSKSLRGIDAFQAQVLEILAKLANNPKVIGIGAAVLVVALGGTVGVRYGLNKSQEKRANELAKIDQTFEDEMKSFGKQREDLEKKRDTLRAALPNGSDKATAETPEIKALDASIQALKADHSKSAQEYKAYYDQNPKSAEGLVAGLKYASFAAEKGDLEAAQKALEAMAEPSQSYSILKVQTYLLLISVLEDRDQLDKALEYSDKFLKVVQPDLKAKALLTKGQILLLKKDFSQAQATLNQLVSEHDNSMEADRARSLLALVPQQAQ